MMSHEQTHYTAVAGLQQRTREPRSVIYNDAAARRKTHLSFDAPRTLRPPLIHCKARLLLHSTPQTAYSSCLLPQQAGSWHHASDQAHGLPHVPQSSL